MEITFLKKLEENPKIGPKSTVTSRGLSLSEISQLETNFNAGNTFPLVLKELLFLAGDLCPYLEYSIAESHQGFQDDVREVLGYDSLVISRPFMAIDFYDGGDWFDIVYLDEGDNPPVYKVESRPETSGSSIPKIHSLDKSLSEYIDIKIYASKVGNRQL
jgi:hypothetical protein